MLSLFVGVLAVVAVSTVSAITRDVYLAREEQLSGRDTTFAGTLDFLPSNAMDLHAICDASEVFNNSGGGAALVIDTPHLTGIGTPDHARYNMPFEPQRMTFLLGRLDLVHRLPLIDGRWIAASQDTPVQILVNLAGAGRYGSVGTPLALATSAQARSLTGVIVGVIADGQPDAHVYVDAYGLAQRSPDFFTDATGTLLLHLPGFTATEYETVGAAILATGGTSLTVEGMRRHDTTGTLIAGLRTQQLAFLGAGALMLIVASLGILNIGLAAISERSRELVVRRAVGATRSDLVGQVLLAASVPALAATGAALAVAVVVVHWWIPGQIPPHSAITPPTVPWDAMIAGLAAAMCTALLGALAPAIIASRLDVADTLRE
jgi:putative ABC transport system permease protein